MKSELGIDRERLCHPGVDFRWEIGALGDEARAFTPRGKLEFLDQRTPAERDLPRQGAVGDGPQRIDVDAVVEHAWIPPPNFGRDVAR